MKNKECSNCIWADIAEKPRVIVKGNITLHQSPGGINCTCPVIKEMTITGNRMLCSSYKAKGEKTD